MKRRRRLLALMVGTVVVAITVPTVAAATTVWTNGWTVHAVLTDSMAPGIPRGSAVIAEPVDVAKVRPGSIIVFTDPLDTDHTVVHRVRRVLTRSGGVFFETQGDRNSSPDPGLVPARLIRGRVETRILGLGGAVNRMSDPSVGAFLVGGALFVFALSEVGGKVAQRHGRLAAVRRERDVLRRRVDELEAARLETQSGPRRAMVPSLLGAGPRRREPLRATRTGDPQ